ncbi:MAG: 50S ribosomal protein L11 methyltransferase [Sphingobacteriaceae bacterium]
MSYRELLFTQHSGESYAQDILIAELAEIGFDTFEEVENGFKAFIPSTQFDEYALQAILKANEALFQFTYQNNHIPQKNWNEVWESNFEPIFIADKIYVRATFHPARPEFPYEIVIDPKMAFGTGHHQTTSLIMEMMLEEDFVGKKVLDMGCGTGILAILAEKMGATQLDAIDYDPLSYESTMENAAFNGAHHIRALCGSKEVIPQETYDIILANINRNILLDQLDAYAAVLIPGGKLYLSGFYETPDWDILKEKAGSLGLTYQNHRVNKDWTAAKFIK